VLTWETTGKHQKVYPRFDRRKPIAGITLTKIDHLDELRQAWNSVGIKASQNGSLSFYSNGTVLKDLMILLRNCAAHGHYTRSRAGWIVFQHEYRGAIKLFGEVRFSKLQELIESIGIGNDHA